MDVKSAFLNWILEEEVYVEQPKGFNDPHPNCTLFIRKTGKDILIAQIYVDNIVFGAIVDSHSHTFAEEMKKIFEMSMIGELSYFRGLQVQQSDLGMFVSQAKYAKELLKKFGLDGKSLFRTPMSISVKLSANHTGNSVNQTLYRSMIESL
ncbi:uncharacterized mitochondrial protein AtMg00810-like [Corylus avellana]|uniref:uncharacterized mitochondrial protein AtMg00810-like n=1 Tax=Corylus avellana TaxID=13451 RepID=UPI00286BBC60|nr:uncharacterized mitochondrial protein AtMg00810-like [Corylus avellana]